MIQDHPFQPSPHPDDTGEVCIFPVTRGDTTVHCGKAEGDHEDASAINRRANPEFDFDKTYYLAGPMSGYPEYNYPAFHTAAWALRNTGIKIESPAEVPWPEGHETMPDAELWAYMMEQTGIQMERCQGIILMKGWPQSTGAKIELVKSLEKGWPVWYYHDFNLLNMNRVEG